MAVELQDIVEIIQSQFDTVLATLKASSDEDVKKEVSKVTAVVVSNTQTFKSLEDEVIRRNKGTVWVVVSFGSGTSNYGARAFPTTLSIFGFPNSILPTQYILTSFVSTYTTKMLGDDNSSVQVWNTPSVFSNFSEVGDHFRSIFSVSGVVVLGTNTVKLGSLTYYYDDSDPTKYETIDFMQFNTEYRASPSPQPFGNTEGFTKTSINFSSDTFTISTYLLNTQLIADAMNVKGLSQSLTGDNVKTSTKQPNDWFKIIFTFTNGFTNATSEEIFQNWKLVSFSIDQPLGDITKTTLTFTH